MTNTAFSNVLTDNALSKTNIWRKTDTSHFRNTNDKSKDSTKLLAVKHSGSLDNNYEHYNKSRFKLERTPSSPKKPERHTQLQDNDYQHYNKSRFKLEKTSSSPKKPERHNEPQKNIYEHYSTSRFKLEKAPSSPKKPGTLLKKSLSEGNLVKTNSYQGNGSEVISSTNETSTLLFPSRHVWTSNSPSKLNSTEFNISMRQNSISKVGGKSYKQPSNFVSLTTECTASPGSSRLVWTNPLSTNSFFKPQKTVTSPLKQPEGTDTKSIKNANISKHVWKRNTADPSSSQKGETAVRSLKKHKWVKSTSKQMSLKPRKAKSFSGSSDRFSRSSVYSWSSIDSKGSSFLARRAKTVVKQSRFALVRSHGSSSESVSD